MKSVPPTVKSTDGGTTQQVVVASPSVLHEVKHPNLVGRVNWEWQGNQGQENSSKEFGVKANRKSTFEMKARRRQVRGVIVVVEYYIILIKIVVDVP